MSQSTRPTAAVPGVSWSDAERDRIEQAAAAKDYADATAFVRDAVLEAVDDVLDEDGPFECPHEDCDEEFATERQRLGHLGSDAHGLDIPDGDFWCGYCGDGPFSWRGVNAHHGSSDGHDGEPIRLDAEPSESDLVGVDDIPDHKDRALLEELYDEYDSISELCREHDFDVQQGTVRTWLIKYDIHEVTPHGEHGSGAAVDGDLPPYRDAERMRELYDEYDGNLSAMARAMPESVSYTNVRKWAKKLGVHDPDAPAPPQRPDDTTDTDDVGDATTSEVEPESAPERPADADGDFDDPASEDTPPSPRAQLLAAVDDARLHDLAPDVSDFETVTFADLATPDWMVEASFHVALEIASTPSEFAEKLGWGTAEDLLVMVALVDELDAFDEWRSALVVEVPGDV